MNQATDLTLPCLVHDLNNVFQTLVEAADLLAEDPQWAPVSAVILRSIERGKGITESMQQAEQAPAPFETILGNAIAFAEDSLIGGRRYGALRNRQRARAPRTGFAKVKQWTSRLPASGRRHLRAP